MFCHALYERLHQLSELAVCSRIAMPEGVLFSNRLLPMILGIGQQWVLSLARQCRHSLSKKCSLSVFHFPFDLVQTASSAVCLQKGSFNPRHVNFLSMFAALP